MSKQIVIAGASGFIGQYLSRRYVAAGHTVSTIGRSGADADWSDSSAIVEAVDGTDLLINLAGKSVNCRYTATNRSEILSSRVETTKLLAQAIASCASPPPLWINSSTATIYRHADDRPMTESAGEIGEGFSVEIASAWEREFFAAELPNTRRVALRIAIVLGDGSALAPLIRLARLGLGGTQYDGRWFASAKRRAVGVFHEFRPTAGRQRFSWVHIDDVRRIIDFVEEHDEIAGVVNVSAPSTSDNAALMRTVRQLVGAPFGLPVSRWMLELGAVVIRTETELVLKSRWVAPERLLALGYRFDYSELEPALRSLLSKRATP